jgi:hypothetical protein
MLWLVYGPTSHKTYTLKTLLERESKTVNYFEGLKLYE